MKTYSRLCVLVIYALIIAFAAACGMGRKSETKPAETGGSGSSSASTASTSTKAPPATVPTAANIAGKYNITGTNPDGAPYRGTLDVIAHGNVYQFRWNAGSQYDGVGVVNGEVAAVSFTTGENGEGCGVIDYVIQTDGTLDGKWGYWGVNEVGTERATRTSGSGLEGEYDATGKNPNGREYRVKLSVEAVGDLYKFLWTNNTEGVGIKTGNGISVGIGGNRCGFVAYQIKPDGTLDGIWGGSGSDKTGTEKAVKQ
jgi:hypothetical protein